MADTDRWFDGECEEPGFDLLDLDRPSLPKLLQCRPALHTVHGKVLTLIGADRTDGWKWMAMLNPTGCAN